jgi:tRNA(Ile)-lysidine synthase
VSAAFQNAIAAFSPALPLVVAYSGGADSTALLLACVEKWPGQVRAVHVHHGLQAAADDFQRHCESFCAQLSVPLTVQRVDARHAPGQSPEDAARNARYEAFRSLALVDYGVSAPENVAKNASHLTRTLSMALAQHADDQAETLLLALSRGAGLAGLSAMPAAWTRDGISYHRPLLGVSAAEIRAWLAGRGVAFVEDPTNVDERFTRNRIRARLLPALDAVFPHFRDTFARSARHAAQAQALLQELAEQDLAAVGQPPAIQALQHLSRARQANVLRHWLKQAHQVVPSAAQLGELLDQVAACTTRGHHIHVKAGPGYAERQGDTLTWYNPSPLR